jgi:hypothetical protein
MAWVLYRLKYWLALCTNDEWPWICTVRVTARRPHFLSSMYQQKFKFRYRYCLSHWSNLTHQQFCQSTSDFSCNVLYIPIILCMPLSLHTLTLTDCVKNRSSLNHFISIFLQFFLNVLLIYSRSYILLTELPCSCTKFPHSLISKTFVFLITLHLAAC